MGNFRGTAAAALLSMVVGGAFAGGCVLAVRHTVWPSEDQERFALCDGVASCNPSAPAASLAQCALEGKAGCENERYDITPYKEVTATYDGAAGQGGKDF